MDPFFLGAGLLGLLFFSSKKASAAAALPDRGAPLPSAPPPGTSTEAQIITPFPAGYRRLKDAEVTPELLAKARAVRSSSGFTSLAYGTTMPFTGSDGAAYAVLVEQHFHEPGGPVKPWGFHHGVTLLAKS